jgi:hypothetical protein
MSATERIVGRPWTKHEDNLLKQAVAIHGENDNWKTVALSVPGRTNKACRKVSIFMYEQRTIFAKFNFVFTRGGFTPSHQLSKNPLGHQMKTVSC